MSFAPNCFGEAPFINLHRDAEQPAAQVPKDLAARVSILEMQLEQTIKGVAAIMTATNNELIRQREVIERLEQQPVNKRIVDAPMGKSAQGDFSYFGTFSVLADGNIRG